MADTTTTTPQHRRKPCSSHHHIHRYISNLEILLQSLQRQEVTSKHAALYHAIEYGTVKVTQEPWVTAFEKINKVEKDCDLLIAQLIRILYEDECELEDEEEEVEGEEVGGREEDGGAGGITGEGRRKLPPKNSPFALQRYKNNRMERSITRQDDLHRFKHKICLVLHDFPFWPERSPVGGGSGGVASTSGTHHHNGKQYMNNGKKMKDLVFWTEHHILLLLSSAFLYFQYMLTRHGSNSVDHTHYTGTPAVGATSAKGLQSSQHGHSKGNTNHNNNNNNSSDNNPENMKSYRYKCNHYRQLLLTYFFAYCERNIVCFEVNSHVYLAYSMAALLNLIDFAKDEEIIEKSRKILNGIVYQIMLCTDANSGTANLCASTRSPVRMTQRTYGHTMGQFIRLMTNSPDQNTSLYEPNYLSSFLATTRWLPEERAFTEALYGYGEIARRLPCNRSEAELIRLFGNHNHNNPNNTANKDMIPMYWSAGGMILSTLRSLSQEYIDLYGLTDHIHLSSLWSLEFLSFLTSSTLFSSSSFDHFYYGQSCLGIHLNVYKLPNLVLSSFDMFSPHYCSFEQLPWIVNFEGIPIYSRSGSGLVMKGVNIANTHNPACKQCGNVLLASYVKPPVLESFAIQMVLSGRVHLLWPLAFFDRHWIMSYGSQVLHERGLLSIPKQTTQRNGMHWFLGQRGNSYIACLFTKPWEWSNKPPSEKDTFQLAKPSPEVAFDCITTRYKQVSIVCVVGSKLMYETIEEFVCCKISNIIIEEGTRDVSVNTSSSGKSSGSATTVKEYYVRVTDRMHADGLLEYSCHIKDPYESMNRKIQSYKNSRFPFEDENSLLLSSELIEIPSSCIIPISSPETDTASSTFLGEGSFGIVERAYLQLIKDGPNARSIEVAVKIPKLMAEDPDQIVNELSLIKDFNKLPYLVQCYGCVTLNNVPALVLEHAPYGSLMDVIQARKFATTTTTATTGTVSSIASITSALESTSMENNRRSANHSRRFAGKPFPVGLCCRWLRDIASGLMYLHEKHVIHRDLKPGNILLFHGLKVKITDFGTSKFSKPQPSSESGTAGDSKKTASRKGGKRKPGRHEKTSSNGDSESDSEDDESGDGTHECVGTLVYMAPEIRSHFRAVSSSDIFSLSMTALHLFSNRIPKVSFISLIDSFELPFEEENHWTKTFYEEISRKIKSYIQECASYDIHKPEDYGRPCARVVHGYFKNLLMGGLELLEEEVKGMEVTLREHIRLYRQQG